MSLKKLIVSGAAALALVGTASVAANVTLEQDGTGDYLLTPVYYAVQNWSTELKVVNTNTTRAIVAKVVIREARESNEIVDFAIYLTPGDVWTGTIYDDNGVIKVKSDDDSFIIGGKIGSAAGSVGIHPRTETDANGGKHTAWHGYVEIFGLASYNPQAIVDYYNQNDSVKVAGIDVAKLGGSETCPKLDKRVFYAVVKNGQYLRQIGDKGSCKSDANTTDVCNSDLMGKATIYAESSDVNGRRTMMLNMLALGNVSESAMVGNYKVYGAETKLDSVTDKPTTLAVEMDAALAKERIMVMYEGNGQEVYPTRIHFTVPTKKYLENDIKKNLITAYTEEDYYNDGLGDPDNHIGEYYYSLNVDGTQVTFRDNQENCNQCQPQDSEVSGIPQGKDCTIKIHEEVHFFQNDNTNSVEYDSGVPMRELAFKEGGWIDFDLTNIAYDYDGNVSNGVAFHGMPIVPTTFYAKDVQGIYLNNWLYNQYEKAKTQ